MENKVKLLITGGAGFIGSNLVERFLEDERISLVRILDNLSNGYIENLQEFYNHPKFEFIQGDIRDYEICLKACEGINKISHQAALGSVPRSIKDPMTSAEVNVLGTINVMYAAVQQKVERIVLAFSSSTYGDHSALPKIERNIGNPLSPYAVTKSSIEQFAYVFGKTYNLKWIGLRYFNVFGPRQNPDNPYAAVIPIFCRAALNDQQIEINGDGKTSRDFTYVDNIVDLNDLALFTESEDAINQIYNGAYGGEISLNDLVNHLRLITNSKSIVKYGTEREGDIRHSRADIEKAKRNLGYSPKINFEDGLKRTIDWHLSK